MIAARQKRIKVADRSEYGWATVDEYEQDQLAADKEDAKRLEKAEKSASSKAAKRKKVTSTSRSDSGRRPQSRPMEPVRRFPVPGPVNSGQPPPLQAQPYRPRPLGPCWNCLEMGHIKATCPKLTRPYPLNIEPVNECKTMGGKVGSSVTDSDACDTCQPDKVRKGDKGSEPLKACSEKRAYNKEGWNGLVSDKESNGLDPDLSRYWELEQEGIQVSDVQGQLLANIKFWEQVLEAPPQIIDCIKEGYKLPLLSLPEPYRKPNHKSALQNKEFVNQAVSDLINNRCVVIIENVPPVCSPLSVVINDSGKKRLVIDLRHLNQYLQKDSFKYEDLRTAMLLFQKEDYLFSFDLKSGYHHVDIHKQHQKYLGFAWDMGHNLQHYMFKVLPFGLATACYVFTKLLRPLVKYWRSQGLRAIIYLDDGIVAVSGKEAAHKASHSVRTDLAKAGFVEHSAKCMWEPTQNLCWLGFELDLKVGFISVPRSKIMALQTLLEKASEQEVLTARHLASITGKIISMSLALGTIARLQTRSLYALINTRESWCQKLVPRSKSGTTVLER